MVRTHESGVCCLNSSLRQRRQPGQQFELSQHLVEQHDCSRTLGWQSASVRLANVAQGGLVYGLGYRVCICVPCDV